jgi:hypothetical protein
MVLMIAFGVASANDNVKNIIIVRRPVDAVRRVYQMEERAIIRVREAYITRIIILVISIRIPRK